MLMLEKNYIEDLITQRRKLIMERTTLSNMLKFMDVEDIENVFVKYNRVSEELDYITRKLAFLN
jgi:translation elongation factor P/translation initiation factor 5A